MVAKKANPIYDWWVLANKDERRRYYDKVKSLYPPDSIELEKIKEQQENDKC